MTNTNEFAIEIQNLTKTYKSKIKNPQNKKTFFSRPENKTTAAINHLNLRIRKGELFGLLGPNGAGKTTLVKILCTLLPPDEGSAIVNGFDVKKQQMQVKQSIGALFSVGERGFFWRLTGYSNLEFFAAINNVPRHGRQQRIMEVLELVNLKDSAYEVFQKYSGGMKRKLALARALLSDPPILLLDEPTTGLDVTSSRTIRDFIRNDLAKKRGKTILYTTHYIEEASQICDNVAILNKGRVVAQDTPENLKNKTRKGEITDIVVKNMTNSQLDTLKIKQGISSINAEILDPVLGQMHIRIRTENVDTLPAILNFFFNEKIKLITFKQEESTLEDAFIELTASGAET